MFLLFLPLILIGAPIGASAKEESLSPQRCEIALKSLSRLGYVPGPGIKLLEKSEAIPNLNNGIYVGAGQMSKVVNVDTPLGTDFLLLCSGIGIINRSLGLHALFHAPYEFVEDTREVLIYEALEVWGDEFLDGAELFVVPGRADPLRAIANARTLEQFIMGYFRSKGLRLQGIVFAKTEESEDQGRLLLNGGSAYLPSPMIPLRHELRNRDSELTPMAPAQAHRAKFGNEVNKAPVVY